MKEGIRILGIDDSAFEFDSDKTLLNGVVYRGTEFIEDIKSIPIDVDGENSTERVLDLIGKFSNQKQIKAVILDGIAFGGFNLVDIERISQESSKPVVAVTKNEPNREEFREAMIKTGNYDEAFEKLGKPTKIPLDDGKCFIQFSGCTKDEAEEFIKKNIIHGQTPESIRVADMVGRALNPE